MCINIKTASIIASALMLSACGKGDTSVDNLPVNVGAVPAAFVGTYTGELKAEAKKGVLKVDATDPITVIVRANNTIEFLGDDPDERFETIIGENGNFNGVLPIQTSSCSGDLEVSGTVDGVTASGKIGGEGRCSGLGSVGVSGSFRATR